jgi:hypothetical protein
VSPLVTEGGLLPDMPGIRRLAVFRASLGEGPYWDARTDSLYFVTSEALRSGATHRPDVSSRPGRRPDNQRPSLERRAGIVALAADLHFDPRTAASPRRSGVLLPLTRSRITTRKVDRQGRFFAVLDHQPVGTCQSRASTALTASMSLAG